MLCWIRTEWTRGMSKNLRVPVMIQTPNISASQMMEMEWSPHLQRSPAKVIKNV